MGKWTTAGLALWLLSLLFCLWGLCMRFKMSYCTFSNSTIVKIKYPVGFQRHSASGAAASLSGFDEAGSGGFAFQQPTVTQSEQKKSIKQRGGHPMAPSECFSITNWQNPSAQSWRQLDNCRPCPSASCPLFPLESCYVIQNVMLYIL